MKPVDQSFLFVLYFSVIFSGKLTLLIKDDKIVNRTSERKLLQEHTYIEQCEPCGTKT